MTDRSLLGAGWTWGIALAASCLVGCGSAPAPQPEATPVVTMLAPERPVAPPVTEPPMFGAAPPAALPPVDAVASPEPPAAASPGEPTPDPAEAQRKAQEERVRSEVAAAKARAESLTATANSECPEPKPGEMRHPGAVGRCAGLKSQAAQAVQLYEALKSQAQAQGITVQ